MIYYTYIKPGLVKCTKLREVTDQFMLNLSNNCLNLIDKNRINYRLSTTEEEILSVLRNQSLYGFLITQAITEASNGARKINMGSLYPTLRKLEKKGFLDSYWEGTTGKKSSEEKDRSGARRRYYMITSKGIKVLQENHEIRENLLSWKPKTAYA